MVTLEAILERNNLNRAYKQVKANRGGPGVDGMTVDELLDYLRAHAVEIVETVKAGKYKPQPGGQAHHSRDQDPHPRRHQDQPQGPEVISTKTLQTAAAERNKRLCGCFLT